ncbi:MAG: hypothetical protein ACI4MS_03065 [Candidatus Coproplasma sp.]
MKDEKRTRIIVAIIVATVIFVFILFTVVIAQVVEINVLKRRKQELLERGEQLRAELAEDEDLYDKIQTDEEYYRWYLEYIEVFGKEDPQNILP